MTMAVEQAIGIFEGAVERDGHGVRVTDAAALRSERTDALVWQAVFGEGDARDAARWLLWELGQATGARPASIHELYMARGAGKCRSFTVPAMNIRALAYDTARAVLRAAARIEAGAIILEIARSEIAYTDQRPAEYVSVIIGAALREGWTAPLFIQGDHCQVNQKKYAVDPDGEIGEVKKLIAEQVAAGFYNIDVDTSTLVDLSFPTLDEQQRLNYVHCAEIAKFIREREPEGVTVSVGGEIGEVGHKNSTVEELHAFMEGFNRTLASYGGNLAGLSKISVQTGTSHGGVVLPDGTIATVKLDLDALEALSKAAQDEYQMGGAVQHGASTLPADAFGNFPRVEAVEIHLATNFQNMVFEHPALPAALRDEMYAWLEVHATAEKKDGDTPEQFQYKARKRAIGPFKRQLWSLSPEVRGQIAASLEAQFGFLFDQLQVQGTAALVREHVHAPTRHFGQGLPALALAVDDPDAGE